MGDLALLTELHTFTSVAASLRQQSELARSLDLRRLSYCLF